MQTKTCTRCGDEFPATIKYFYIYTKNNGEQGLRSICKECDKKNRKKNYYNNKERESANTKEYRKTEQGKISNRKSVAKYSKTKHGKMVRKAAIGKYNKSKQGRMVCGKAEKRYKDFKYSTDVKYKLNVVLSLGIRRSLNGNKGGRHWESLVGYTLEQLKDHLESLFQSGMSWDNYGFYGWHIDHKRPISSFSFTEPEDEEFKQCWALENLQPLWAEDNIKKSDKWEAI